MNAGLVLLIRLFIARVGLNVHVAVRVEKRGTFLKIYAVFSRFLICQKTHSLEALVKGKKIELCQPEEKKS